MGNFLVSPPGSSSTPTERPIQAADLVYAGVLGATPGNIYYLDVVNGDDNNSGTAPNAAVQHIPAGYALLVEGHNDILVPIGNGLITGSALLTGAFDWHKNAAHMVGACSPTLYSQRARIAPVATPPFANFFTVSGSGCFFSNIEFVTDFTLGAASEICMTVTGQRNVFSRCHLAGMIGATAAASAASRNLLISGGGENFFSKCTIGVDTTPRTAANASVQFASYSVRNVFEDCVFPIYVTGGGTAALLIYAAATHSMDRQQTFRRCIFLNAGARSGGADVAAMATLGAATGGEIVLDSCPYTGITALYSDATTQAQMKVNAGTVLMTTPS
jgi:hypothetical protein